MPRWWPYVLIGALALALLLLSVGQPLPPAASTVPYSRFKELVLAGKVEEVVFRGEAVHARLKEPLPAAVPEGAAVREIETRLPPLADPELLPALERGGVLVRSLPAADGNGAGTVFYLIAPWLILIALYLWFWRRVYRNLGGGLGGTGDLLGGGWAVKRSQAGATPKVTFKDVAGQDNAKAEVAELVDLLRDPQKYTRLGAEAPHGILLVGPPGTGKTLLARALAGEAGVPFFNTSASEFIEVFVGVGASRVRKMFEEAKRRAPSIVFIDELDAVGRMRGAGIGGGHDEREQTLNQILSEMDGFAGHEAVVVLAATNRPDVLDPALLRPGRFDRHVTLELPDRAAREAILRVHVRKVPLAADVDLTAVAAQTPGFSGADLKNLVNEAAMAAAREGAPAVAMRHLDAMRDKLIMGAERRLIIGPGERHRLAVHEAGHAVVAHFLPEADPLYKVSIIPRGQTLGGTHLLPGAERYTLPEGYLKDQLALLLGGRMAERAVLGGVSSGADDDIRRATALARAMVARWGMAEEVGPVDLRQSEEHPFLGREIARPRGFSEATAHEVDAAVGRLLRDAEERAGAIVGAHRAELERLAAALEERETLDRAAVEAICRGPAPDRRRAPPPSTPPPAAAGDAAASGRPRLTPIKAGKRPAADG